jgi:hypothetical protein
MSMMRVFLCALIAVGFMSAGSAFAQEAAGSTTREDAYAQAIEKRTQDVLSTFNLQDAAKRASIHDAVIDQYRGLKAWHDANDARVKELSKRLGKAGADHLDASRAETAKVKSSLKTLHDGFIARLSTELTPEQVEQVKDKLTYNVVQVTCDAYGQMLPELTAAQKERILGMLKEAREEAMDGGSAAEKHAVFGRYKGRINNYLAAEGYDVKKASKEFAERSKGRQPKPDARP